MSVMHVDITERERELGAIIHAYNEVTERLKQSHEVLTQEVGRLRSELARKNRQLRRRERLAALGEMAAGLAHEIRNPLGGIRVFASLLEKDLADRPDACRMVRKIDAGVGRLETIVTDILEFGRPANPQPAPVSVKRLMSETMELVGARRGEHDVEILIDQDDSDLVLQTDSGLLQRAMLNLALNAVEAIAGQKDRTLPGRVMMRSQRADATQARLQVIDNGPGIARSDLDRIFNPFFTRKDKGTGLGLAIVHQIVESLGGQIGAGNRREGGAIFTITLPLEWNEVDRDK
jgi:signal transduction histidine kinase